MYKLLTIILIFDLNILLIQAIPNCTNFMQVSINEEYGNILIPNISTGDNHIQAYFSQSATLPKSANFTGLLQPYGDRPSIYENIQLGRPIDFFVLFPKPKNVPNLLHLVVNGDIRCSNSFNSKDSRDSLFYLSYFLPNQTSITTTTTTTTTTTSKSILLYDDSREYGLNYNSKQNTLAQEWRDYLKIKNSTKTNDYEIQKVREEHRNCASNIKTITPFIYSEMLLQRGQFPWLTAIFRKRSRGTSFLCGGSLISSRTVISAAHCFVLSSLTANRIIAYMGHNDLDSYGEEGFIIRDVERLVIHPEYNMKKLADADLGLLILKRSVVFTEFVQPICLWNKMNDENDISNRNGLIAGWGSDELGNDISPLAKIASARIVSEVECLRNSISLRNFTSSRTLCAGNRDDTGPCTGDSGGGLVINQNGRWMLRGILSAGLTIQRRCDLREYVIYCDLAKHLKWVLENIVN